MLHCYVYQVEKYDENVVTQVEKDTCPTGQSWLFDLQEGKGKPQGACRRFRLSAMYYTISHSYNGIIAFFVSD